MELSNIEFESGYKVSLEERSSFGLLSFTEVVLTEQDLNLAISEIVSRPENLARLFDVSISDENLGVCLNRFLTPDDYDTLETYVENQVHSNHNFYSFLAEAILAIVMRRLYGYNLICALLKPEDTIITTHSGVDCALIDFAKESFIIGEAKFYSGERSFQNAFAAIKRDFTRKKGYRSKFGNLLNIIRANPETRSILVKTIGKEPYRIKLSDLGKIKLVFAGIVIHETDDFNSDVYKTEDFYHWNLTINELAEGLKAHLSASDVEEERIELILVHLPIVSKKALILKMMETAQLRLNNISQ